LAHACSLAVSTAAVAGAFRITRHLKQTGVGSEPASAMPHAKCHRHMLFIGSHAKATSLSSPAAGWDTMHARSHCAIPAAVAANTPMCHQHAPLQLLLCFVASGTVPPVSQPPCPHFNIGRGNQPCMMQR
jgi:hypothetical protein